MLDAHRKNTSPAPHPARPVSISPMIDDKKLKTAALGISFLRTLAGWTPSGECMSAPSFEPRFDDGTGKLSMVECQARLDALKEKFGMQ